MAATKDVRLRLVIQSQKEKVDADLNALAAAVSSLGSAIEQLSNKTKEFTNKISSALDAVKQKTDSVKTTFDGIGDSMVTAGTAVGAFAASIGVPMGYSIKMAYDFERQMNKVKAIMDAAGETSASTFQAMVDQARKLGQQTEYTQTQAGEALQYLKQAGVSAQDAMAALPGVLNLATAAAIGLGQAADISASIMVPFKIKAENLDRVINTLAITVSRSNTNISDLAEAMKYAAPIAATAGMSVEETAAAMGALANAGIKGSMAGTEIRGMLAALSDQTKDTKEGLASLGVEVVRYSNGQVNLIETLRALSNAHMTATDAFKIFTRHTAAGAVALASNIATVDQLTVAMKNDTTAATRMAETMRSGLYGAIQILSSSIEALGEKLASPFLAPISKAVLALADFINKLFDLANAYPKVAYAVGLVSGTIFALVTAFSVLMLVIGGSIKLFSAVWNVATKVAQAFAGMATATEASATAHTAAAAAVNTHAAALERFKRSLDASKGGQTGTGTSGTPGQTPPAPVPTGSEPTKQKFGGGKAAAGVGAATAGLMIASGSELLDAAKYAAINAGITLIATNIGVVIAKVGALIGALGGISGVMWTIGTAIATAGGALLAFLTGPIGLTIVAVTAIVGLISSAYKASKDKAEAAEIDADRMKKAQADLQRAIKEGANVDQKARATNTAQLATDPQLELIKKRKQAVADWTAWNEKLTIEQSKKGGGDEKEVEAIKENIKVSRENIDVITKEINSRIDQQNALKKVGNEYDALAKTTQKASDILMAESKARQEIGLKLVQDNAKKEVAANQQVLESKKASLLETMKSEQLANREIEKLQQQHSQKSAAISEAAFQKVQAIALREYQVQQAILQKQLKESPESKMEVSTKRAELDKNYLESRMQAYQNHADEIAKLLDEETKQRQEQAKKIMDIEKQIRDEQAATRDALLRLTQANLNEYYKLKSAVGEVADKYREAQSLMASQPERALELFKQVRSESSSLVQSVTAVNDKIIEGQQTAEDALRKMGRIGMGPWETFQADIQDIQVTMERAAKAEGQMKLAEAEKLYAKAIQMASQLPTQIPKGENKLDEKQNIEWAKGYAVDLIAAANQGMLAAQGKMKEQAEQTNKAVEGMITGSGDSIQQLLSQQQASARANIEALDRNTEALTKQLAKTQEDMSQAQQKASEFGGPVPSPSEISPELPAAIKQLEDTFKQTYDKSSGRDAEWQAKLAQIVSERTAASGKFAFEADQPTATVVDRMGNQIANSLQTLGQGLTSVMDGIVNRTATGVQDQQTRDTNEVVKGITQNTSSLQSTVSSVLTGIKQTFEKGVDIAVKISDNNATEATITRY